MKTPFEDSEKEITEGNCSRTELKYHKTSSEITFFPPSLVSSSLVLKAAKNPEVGIGTEY